MNAISSLLIITALLPVASAQDTRIIKKPDIVYAEPASPLHTLDVYASPSAKNAPVVFWIHGGGWQGGDKSDVAEKPHLFVEEGFVFVSVNYRLLPKVEMIDIFYDVAKSFRWMHDHIAEYGGDPKRVLVGGHSAGAQLAALLCTDDRYLKAEGIAFTDLIGCVPVDGDTYDVPAIIETGETRRRVHGQPQPQFGHREKFGNTAEKHREYSSVTHVAQGKSIPPFLILHVADHPDTSAQAFRLGTVLKAAGVKTTVFGARETNHSKLNDNLGAAGDPATKVLLEFVDACLGKAAAQRPARDFRKEWKMARMDEARSKEWLARWEKNMVNEERNRYCDKAVGEDVAWLMTPFMDGLWNYWEPAGPWDYKPDGRSTKHWVGVHPNEQSVLLPTPSGHESSSVL
jgi:acetyl esterase/lipase